MKIFLSTHGKMASGMKNSLDILLGNTDCLTVFDAYINEDSVDVHVDAFFEANPTETKVLCSDIYSGSVNQILARYCEKENTYVITGINLALLMSLVLAAEDDPTREEIEELVEDSRQMTKLVTLDFDVPEQGDFF